MTIHKAIKEAVVNGDVDKLKKLRAIAQTRAKYASLVTKIQAHIDTLES